MGNIHVNFWLSRNFRSRAKDSHWTDGEMDRHRRGAIRDAAFEREGCITMPLSASVLSASCQTRPAVMMKTPGVPIHSRPIHAHRTIYCLMLLRATAVSIVATRQLQLERVE